MSDASDVELEAFHAALDAAPNDFTAMAALADWLEDHNSHLAAGYAAMAALRRCPKYCSDRADDPFPPELVSRVWQWWHDRADVRADAPNAYEGRHAVVPRPMSSYLGNHHAHATRRAATDAFAAAWHKMTPDDQARALAGGAPDDELELPAEGPA